MRIQFLTIIFLMILSFYSCIPKSQRIIRRDFYREKSKLFISAFYCGTQNQSTIHLYTDNKFYINHTGVFFYNSWSAGDWNRNGDTLNLIYDTRATENILGNKIIIGREWLLVYKKTSDSTNNRRVIKYRIMKPEMGKTIKFDNY